MGAKCKECNNKGVVTYDGEVEINGHGYELYEAYKMLRNYQIWPINAGLKNQDCVFIDAIEHIDFINGRYLSIVEEENRAVDAFAARFKK